IIKNPNPELNKSKACGLDITGLTPNVQLYTRSPFLNLRTWSLGTLEVQLDKYCEFHSLFSNDVYKTSGGLHRVEVTAVNTLSVHLKFSPKKNSCLVSEKSFNGNAE
ncbi:5160_t:CDS:2, partial [Gigaspora rosea]